MRKGHSQEQGHFCRVAFKPEGHAALSDPTSIFTDDARNAATPTGLSYRPGSSFLFDT